MIFSEFPGSLSGVEGFIDLRSKEIFVNKDSHPNRQTFTIAHELGHAFLHLSDFEMDPSLYQVLMRKPIGSVTDPFEQEANTFAHDIMREQSKQDCISPWLTATNGNHW